MAANEDMSRGPVLLSISLGTVSFALVTVMVRFAVRARISYNMGMDDYALGVATVSNTATAETAACVCVCV